jgi:hypothetical protein
MIKFKKLLEDSRVSVQNSIDFTFAAFQTEILMIRGIFSRVACALRVGLVPLLIGLFDSQLYSQSFVISEFVAAKWFGPA